MPATPQPTSPSFTHPHRGAAVRIDTARLAALAAYPHIAGPQIVLCTAGGVRVGCGDAEVHLTPGQSAFVGATGGPVTLTGAGEIFRAFAGDLA